MGTRPHTWNAPEHAPPAGRDTSLRKHARKFPTGLQQSHGRLSAKLDQRSCPLPAEADIRAEWVTSGFDPKQALGRIHRPAKFHGTNRSSENSRPRASKAWYHFIIALHDPHGRVAWQS